MGATALLILDGFGIGENDPKSNAIVAAGTPVLDKLKAEYCCTAIGASGLDVGLPDGQMGNSEVGHTNIGAGRVVYQMLVKITKDIQDGVFFENKAKLSAMENCKANDSALHLIGLVSPGSVHSHTEHLYGIPEMAKRHGLKKVFVHCLLDGRDVPPDSGWEYVKNLVATDAQANETIGVIRKAIEAKFGRYAAEKIRIQYGGSMKGSNVKGLMAQPEIDGGLIGGASLKAADFAQVVNF